MTKQQQIAQTLQSAIKLHQSGEIEPAIPIYRQVLALDSRNADANHLLGLALHQSGQDDQAIPLFNRALMILPNNPPALGNFAELWRKQKNYAKAMECYEKLLVLTPNDNQVRELWGEALIKLERFEEGLAYFQKVIDSGKDTADTWWSMSEILRMMDRVEESVTASLKATQKDPNSAGAWHSLGWNLIKIGKVRESIPCFNRAIELIPNRPLLYWRRAWALLLLGQYEQAWHDYEARWYDEDLQLPDRRPFPGPLWKGEDLGGKTIFIHMEQGIGDAMQFVRYLPMVQERGGKLIAESHTSMHSLLTRSYPQIDFRHEPMQLPVYDYHLPLLSLPHIFRTTIASVPAKVPYLVPDSAAVQSRRQRLAREPGLKVGLAWAGSPAHKNDRQRSIRLDRLAPLAQVPGVRFVSLQKGTAAEQLAQMPAFNMLDWTAELNDWDATAALVDALDLVISVDTSVAHLAGALAKPTWTLLPFAPDFRWMIERDDTPWYPTMRLFRQPTLRDWESVAKTVSEALAGFVAEKGLGEC
jgi:tetratricopeptide (TPR) repeat protein